MSFGAGALVIHKGYVLACLRGKGEHEPLTWSVFGGMAEEGEDPHGCMIREIKEEAGIDLSSFDAHLIDTFDEGNGFSFYTFAIFIPPDEWDRASAITLNDEIQAWCWAAIDTEQDDPYQFWRQLFLLDRPLHSGLRRLLLKPQVVRAIKSIRLMTAGGDFKII